MRHIVIAGTVLAALALTLPGCGRSKRVVEPQPTPAATTATSSSSDGHYREALSAWDAWHATGGCTGPERNALIAAIGRLKNDSAMWRDVEGEFPWEARIARERHSSAAFAFADEAMARGCHADAERMFRHVFEFYAAPAHAGIRDRARAGMEESRSARGVAEVGKE